MCPGAIVSRLFIARETTATTGGRARSPRPEMERNHYLSGSFDGLSDGHQHHHHFFKSSFAKSMALETTKSLNFADLDLTGNERYNTVRSQRQVNRRLSQRFETNENNESFEFIRKEYKHLQNLYNDLRSKHEKLMQKDANDQAPCIELTLAKSQVDTLQWQLKQVEASNQMYKAVLEQVSKFLEKAHTSLNTTLDKPNLPIKNRRPSLKSNRGEYTEKLSLEAFRLYRTVQSIIHTKEPDLVQHLTPCYSTLFEKNSNSSLCSCDSLPAVCNGVKCLEVSSSSSNHSETSIKGSDFFKKENKQKNNVIEDESGFSSISSHDNSNSPTYPELGLPPTGHFPIDKVSRRWSSVSATPINQSFNYHTTGSSNTSPPIKEKIRRAYAACKRVICCSGVNTEMDQDHVYHVDLTVRPGEQNPSVQLQVVGPLQQQRRRPDVQPIGMRRFADPEKVAAVFKACKELRVPVGENCFKEGDDGGSGSAKETRKNTARTKPKNSNIDSADSQRR